MTFDPRRIQVEQFITIRIKRQKYNSAGGAIRPLFFYLIKIIVNILILVINIIESIKLDSDVDVHAVFPAVAEAVVCGSYSKPYLKALSSP